MASLLSLILISDVDCALDEASESSFVDDTIILIAIGSDEDRYKMQQELNKVYHWANNNAMLFNDTKFEYLSVLDISKFSESIGLPNK